MAEAKEGSRERRTRVAEVVDAGAEAADKLGRLPPSSILGLAFVVLLSFLCAGFGALLWNAQEQQKARERETREAFSALMREANAREELRAIHCAAEAEKVRRDSAATVQAVVQAFIAEGERNRTAQATENAKFRAEFLAALKGKAP